jgi:predicted phosphodiesterase
MNFNDFRVLMIHIGGAPYKYPAKAKELITKYKPHLYICGHSHILRVVTDKSQNNMLYMNPGAAGTSGFHHIRTILRFEILNQKIVNLQAIELGPRAQKKQD